MIVLYILQMIFFTTLWTMGWKIATSEGMVLEKLGEWGKKKVEDGNKIFDGLIVCEFCVPNFHGLLFVYPICFALGVMPDWEWWRFLLAYPFTLAGSSFLSGRLWGEYLLTNRKSDYYEAGAAYYDKVEQLAHFDVRDRKAKHKKKEGTQSA